MVVREKIAHYRIVRKLGEGGMGVVFAAEDEQLGRPVALKLIQGARRNEQARERFWREARAAARVSHPNICHIYEVGEHDGELFLAMELLDGESLATVIARSPLAVGEALRLMLQILEALQAIHTAGLVHRDLKPSNILLTSTGPVLDFGLARADTAETSATVTALTLPGITAGATPQYMAPERLTGAPADARADVFSAGAVLFEMLAGKPAFGEGTVMQVLHSVLYERPAVLGGSSAIAAADRIVHRALSRKPEDRYPSARAMADDVRHALQITDTGETVRARSMSRLIVLPFRVLRNDPEIDFLAFSLADAISSSLSGLESLIVRSSATASRYAGETPDLTPWSSGLTWISYSQAHCSVRAANSA